MVLKNQQCLQCDYKTTKKSYLKGHIKSVHEGQKFSCAHCGSTFTQKANLQTHIRSVHEGQKFSCTHCEYKVTWKILLQKHVKSVHGKVRSELMLKTEYLTDNGNMAMEEYFERDVKCEDDFDVEIESKELKHEFIFENAKEGMTEYFETDVVKYEV